MGGQEEAAREMYERSAEVSNTYDGALARLGKIWLKRGNYTKALDYYKIIVNQVFHSHTTHSPSLTTSYPLLSNVLSSSDSKTVS